MPLELTEADLIGLEPDSLLAGLRDLVTVTSDTPATPSPESESKPATTITPLRPAQALPTATTSTYTRLRALLALSAATYGSVPVVTRVSGGYAIRIADHAAYGVDITEPLATCLSLYILTAGRWHVLDRWRLPKLTPRELIALFVLPDPEPPEEPSP